jgi:hypothetical protein
MLLTILLSAHLAVADDTPQKCLNTTATKIRYCHTYFSRDLKTGKAGHSPGDELANLTLKLNGTCIAEDHEFQSNGTRYVYVQESVVGGKKFHFERSLRRAVDESTNKVLVEDYWHNTDVTTDDLLNSGYFIAECELTD